MIFSTKGPVEANPVACVQYIECDPCDSCCEECPECPACDSCCEECPECEECQDTECPECPECNPIEVPPGLVEPTPTNNCKGFLSDGVPNIKLICSNDANKSCVTWKKFKNAYIAASVTCSRRL